MSILTAEKPRGLSEPEAASKAVRAALVGNILAQRPPAVKVRRAF